MSRGAQQFAGDIVGIDVGGARIGVARIHPVVKLSEPLPPIIVKNGSPFEAISSCISEHEADAVVFGLPRNLQGNDTDQTRTVQEFVQQFIDAIHPKIPLYFIDEAGTSKEADKRINGKMGISRDSMSACIMLEDFVDLKDISLLLISNKIDN
jgi:putative transcription antitermination factor YqgF